MAGICGVCGSPGSDHDKSIERDRESLQDASAAWPDTRHSVTYSDIVRVHCVCLHVNFLHGYLSRNLAMEIREGNAWHGRLT
jgi:hypothetical protein